MSTGSTPQTVRHEMKMHVMDGQCVGWCDAMGGSVQQAKQVSKGCRWVADLASEEASRPEVKDHINDLVQGRADAHVLLCIQPT